MLSPEEKQAIRKNVNVQLALEDAIYIMEEYLASFNEDVKDYYKRKMQEFVTKHKK